MKIFGDTVTESKLFLPNASLSWQIGNMFRKGIYDNIVPMTFTTSDNETIDIRRCFNETNHIFAFGRDVQTLTLSVNLAFFLGKMCKSKGANKILTINQAKEKYEKNRIYKNPNPLQITIGEFSSYGYLINMSIGNVDPATQMCILTFTFILDQEV